MTGHCSICGETGGCECEAREMACGLTKRAKHALVDAQIDHTGETFMNTRKYTAAIFDQLYDRGLIFVVMRGVMLTTEGLAVREILLSGDTK